MGMRSERDIAWLIIERLQLLEAIDHFKIREAVDAVEFLVREEVIALASARGTNALRSSKLKGGD